MLGPEPGVLPPSKLPGFSRNAFFQLLTGKKSLQIFGDQTVSQYLPCGWSLSQSRPEEVFGFFDPSLFQHELAPFPDPGSQYIIFPDQYKTFRILPGGPFFPAALKADKGFPCQQKNFSCPEQSSPVAGKFCKISAIATSPIWSRS